MKSSFKNNSPNSDFLMKLGDGSCWSFITTPDTRSWVEKFATVIGLNADDQNKKCSSIRIFFLQRCSEEDSYIRLNPPSYSKIKTNLPDDGWSSVDFGALRLWTNDGIPDIICEVSDARNPELDIIRMWTALYCIYLRSLDSGGLILHGALVERNGRGVLLAGPGGAGKSTLSHRLPPEWCVLSDDQSLVVLDDQNRYLAHPVPTWSDHLWRGSKRSWDMQYHVPLAAIFFINQSACDEVVPIGQGHAAVCINNLSTEIINPVWWNMDIEGKNSLKKKIIDNACHMARDVPAYILRNSLNGRCWYQMEKAL